LGKLHFRPQFHNPLTDKVFGIVFFVPIDFYIRHPLSKDEVCGNYLVTEVSGIDNTACKMQYLFLAEKGGNEHE
jgi:hypothetical protein